MANSNSNGDESEDAAAAKEYFFNMFIGKIIQQLFVTCSHKTVVYGVV